MIGDITEYFNGDRRASIRKYLYVGAGCLVLGFLLGLILPHCGGKKSSTPLQSSAQGVPTHDAKTENPVQAYDKAELQERGAISKEVAKDVSKEVIAAATIEDESGTRNVAAALDKKTGVTELVEKRPFAEWMNRNDIGLGYGIGSGGIEKAVMYEHTFFRVADFYGSIEARVTDPEKDPVRWDAMLWLKCRF